MSKKSIVAAAGLLAAGLANAACYSVFKADGTLIHQSSNAPVNLSLPFSESVTEKYGPGASMTVSDLGFYCKDAREEIAGAKAAAGAVGKADAPAEAMAIKTLSAPGKDPVKKSMQ